MRKALVVVGAIALMAGVAGPVAAKSGGKGVSAKTTPIVASAPVSLSHGDYGAPKSPKLELSPRELRAGRDYLTVKARYFCKNSSVTFTANPSLAGFPVTKSTSRDGNAEAKFSRTATAGWSSGTYTITATQTGTGCNYTVSANLRVRR